jgi:hypothetical protein
VLKRHGRAIGLTSDRCAAVVGSGKLPAGGGGEAVAALPPRLGFRRVTAQCGKTSGLGSILGPYE